MCDLFVQIFCNDFYVCFVRFAVLWLLHTANANKVRFKDRKLKYVKCALVNYDHGNKRTYSQRICYQSEDTNQGCGTYNAFAMHYNAMQQ